MERDGVEIMLRRCRGRDRGIGRVVRDVNKFLKGACLGDLHDDIYKDPVSAVAFQSVASAMSFGSEISGFGAAVDQLGEARVRKAALAAGIIAAIPEQDYSLLFDTTMLRKRCLILAFLQEALAQRCRFEFMEVAFVTGLLMDIGYLLLYETCDTDLQLSLYSRIQNPNVDVVEIERFYMGLDHCHVAATVAQVAKLEPAVVEGIRFHHTPAACDVRYQESADLCHFVSWLADNLRYRIADGLKKQFLESESLSRLSWGNQFKEHITDAVKHATSIADAAIDNALPKIECVRKFAA